MFLEILVKKYFVYSKKIFFFFFFLKCFLFFFFNVVLQLESAFAEVLEKAVVTKEDKGFKVENSNVNVKSSEANSNLIGSSLSTDFAPESSGDSSAIVSSQSTPSKQDYEARKNTFSSLYSLGSASTLSVRSIGSGKSKPPNIFIYSESSTTIENMKSILSETLHKHK